MFTVLPQIGKKPHWLEGLGSLASIALADIPSLERHRSVSSFVSANGQWSWDEFQHRLPSYACLRLASTVPSGKETKPDKIILELI